MRNKGGRPWKNREGALTVNEWRRKLCQEAGISEHQMRQVLRVAAVPKDEFERLIESDNPPSITALAKLG
jgi:hypothetical protein